MNEEENNVAPAPDVSGEEMKMPENADLPPTEKSSSPVTNGPVLIALAVLLLIVLGAMYFWFSSMTMSKPLVPEIPPTERPTAVENNEPESTTAEAQADAMGVVSTSDEIEAIEADIEATDLDSLDAELNAIDAELDAALQE